MLSDSTQDTKFNLEITSIFDWMPICSVITDKDANILDANQEALLFFGAQTKEKFLELCKIHSIFVDKQIALDMLMENSITEEKIKTKILFRRFDKTIACIDIEVALFPKEKNYFLIQFTDNSHESHAIFTNIVQGIRNDILQLKPYLNKHGNELLSQIIFNEKLEGLVKNTPKRTFQNELIRQERIIVLSELYPKLSNNELELCTLLSLKISFEEIAKISGKTSNSLRVAFHRLVSKTDSLKSKDLLKKLQKL